jgi:PAS domain S-box-containing protein
LGDVNDLSREAMQALPAAVYMTDAEGRLTFYNEAAVALWGCRPKLGESKFCGSWKLYWPDGTPLPHNECPMAMALRQKRPIRGMEAVAEHPDGTRIPFIPYPTPLFDTTGRLTGAVNMLVDIRERKRAEEALAERDAQLAVFVEHAPAAIAMFDREMRYLAVSHRFVVDYRLPPVTQLLGQSHYEVFPNVPQRWRDIHARVLAGEELSQEEDQYTRYDGLTDWVRWSMVPWRRANGDVGGALLFAEIITEQVEARRALAESEARFHATFENAAVGVVLVGPDGMFLRVNDSFSRILGYSSHELKTTSIQKLTHPDDLEASFSVLRKILAGEADSYCIEKRFVRKDGGIVWANLNVGCVRKEDGAVDYFISIIEDITHRKQAERALTERNSQLALAEQAALVGSHSDDPGLGRMTISDGYGAIHGLPEGTTETTRGEWRARVHPEDLARVEENRTRNFRDKRDVYNLDYRIVRASGEVRWIEARGIVSYDADGQPRRVIGINIDVTERKQAESLLKESKTRLSDALAAGQVVAFEWDATTGQSRRSDNADRIMGLVGDGRILKQVHPDDRGNFKICIRGLSPSNPSYALTFRFVRPDGGQIWLEETARGEFDGKGRLSRIHGLTRDITERKRVELALAERNAQLGLAGRAALVGSFAYDVETEAVQISEGYATIFGFPEGTTEITRSQWKDRVQPEDLERLEDLRSQAFRQRKGEYSVEYPTFLPGGGVRWIEGRSFVSYDGDGNPRRMVGVNIDVTERKRAEERQGVLVAELDHRVKNVLSSVSAVVAHTRQESSSLADFAEALEGRIQSMAMTHELLSFGRWQGISLTELVRRELAPYATRNNTEINGPEVILRPEAGQAIAMVLHELATNAAKYGALSTTNGHVSIRWDRRPNGHARSQLVLEWQEIGGPPVVATSKPSYGTSTIRDLIPYEFGGTVDHVLAPDGVRCRLQLPGDWLATTVGLFREPLRTPATAKK